MTTHRAPLAGPWSLPVAGGAGSFLFQRSPTHRHQGNDFPAEIGRPALAVGSGLVALAHDGPARGFAGYGRVVALQLDSGEWALYAHLSRVLVTKGQRVTLGQPVGLVGQSQFRDGNALDDGPGPRPGGRRVMGSHLHFEVSTRAYPMGPEAPYRLDPSKWLLKQPSRGAPRNIAARGALPVLTAPAKISLLAQLGRAIAQTEADVERGARVLVEQGLAGPASMVRSAWTTAREQLDAARAAVDPRPAITRAADAWTHTVDEAAAYAARSTDAVVRAAAVELRHAQDEAWRALRDAGRAAVDLGGKVALGGGLVLLLVGLMFAGSLGVSAGGGVAGARHLLGSSR